MFHTLLSFCNAATMLMMMIIAILLLFLAAPTFKVLWSGYTNVAQSLLLSISI